MKCLRTLASTAVRALTDWGSLGMLDATCARNRAVSSTVASSALSSASSSAAMPASRVDANSSLRTSAAIHSSADVDTGTETWRRGGQSSISDWIARTHTLSWPCAMTRGRVAISFARIAWPLDAVILQTASRAGERGGRRGAGAYMWMGHEEEIPGLQTPPEISLLGPQPQSYEKQSTRDGTPYARAQALPIKQSPY